jgi:hypothetical protein
MLSGSLKLTAVGADDEGERELMVLGVQPWDQ